MHKASDIRSVCTAVKVGLLYKCCVFNKISFFSFLIFIISALYTTCCLCVLWCACFRSG